MAAGQALEASLHHIRHLLFKLSTSNSLLRSSIFRSFDLLIRKAYWITHLPLEGVDK
jgi:hypothetical protein